MAVGYRAVLRLESTQNAVAAAEEQIRLWLKGKAGKRTDQQARVEWDGPGNYVISRSLELLVVHADHDDTTPRRLYRITDTNPSGRWIVSVYAATLPSRRGREQTIVVEVDLADVDRETALARVDPPTIVRSILDTYAANDGSVRLTGTPNVVRTGDVEDLLAAITTTHGERSLQASLAKASESLPHTSSTTPQWNALLNSYHQVTA
jgi:hypothetical protein